MRLIFFTMMLVLATVSAAYAQSRDQMINTLVADEMASYKQVLEASNKQTLDQLRNEFGPKVFGEMEKQGVTQQLIASDKELSDILTGIKGIYDKTFTDSELQTMYNCTTAPAYQPVRAKMPQLSAATQEFISQTVQHKMMAVIPVIQGFVARNPDLFQPK